MNIETLIRDNIYKCIKVLRNQIDRDIVVNTKHIIERMRHRDIDLLDVTDLLCQIVNNPNHPIQKTFKLPLSKSPFRVEAKSNEVILMFSRRDNKWVFASVLDPKKHSLYNDELDESYIKRFNFP